MTFPLRSAIVTLLSLLLLETGLLHPRALARGELDDAPRWSPAGGLNRVRIDHTATLLHDGRVLITGGKATLFTSSCEIFQPEYGTLVLTGSMAHERVHHSAVKLDDGRVLVIGGLGLHGIHDTAEIWDPETESWEEVAPLNVPRWFTTATLLGDGRVLVAGGHVSGPETPTASAEVYDPRTNMWTTVPPMSIRRLHHRATALADHRVLVTGGGTYTGSGLLNAVTQNEIFDWRTDSWSLAGNLAIARGEHTSTLLHDERVLVTGGVNFSNRYNQAEIFDPVTNLWSSAPPLRLARESHRATTLGDGRVLVVGAKFEEEGSCEVYDPSTNLWSEGPSLNEIRSQFTMTALADGRVLVAGGHSRNGLAQWTTEVYQESTTPPGGLAISSVEIRKTKAGKSYLLIHGTGFTADAVVFLDFTEFRKPAKVMDETEIRQKGKLVDGRRIDRAVPPGATVRIIVRVPGSPDARFDFTRPS